VICRSCADGGALLVVIGAADVAADNRKAAETLAADLHGACKGGTWCDCIHAGTPHDRRAGGAR
jgi:hypothetical protein